MSHRENKTKPTKLSFTSYMRSLEKGDAVTAKKLVAVFKTATGMRPVMWGEIVGFGSYHYRYETGREGDFLATGFAMRKGGPTIYIMPGYENYGDILKDLGPHRRGKSCLYLKNLDNINLSKLETLIKTGLRDLKKRYPVTAS